MATRETQKTKRAAPRKAAAKSELSGAVKRLEAKIKSLQVERDKLNSELKSAHLRIAELEAAHKDAVNRIDWVIDSLHNIVEEQT